MALSEELVALSKWIDQHNEHKSQQLQLWERCGKIMEEAGEVAAALIGVLGQNPRKGITHTLNDLTGELLDVAITALGAVEHVTGNQGKAVALLEEKMHATAQRAGLEVDSRTSDFERGRALYNQRLADQGGEGTPWEQLLGPAQAMFITAAKNRR